MYDIILKNCSIVNENQIKESDIAIKNQRIDLISTSIDSEAREVIDLNGRYVIPGLIDDQVHFREPGLTHKGDIATESKAGLAGGVTSFFEMPNVNPTTTTNENLTKKFELASTRALSNYSFHLGASNTNIEEIKKVDFHQASALKVFMGASFGEMLVDDIDALDDIFNYSPLIVVTHCEDQKTVKKNEEIYLNKYGEDLCAEHHHLIRDVDSCYLSSSLAVDLAKKYDADLHVFHLTTEKEMELFTPGKVDGKKITAEVCVHHMYFNESRYADLGNQIKCNPSIKFESDRLALIDALLQDKIDIIATDHAPHAAAEKDCEFDRAPFGIIGLENALAATLGTLYHSKRMNLSEVIALFTHKGAEICKLEAGTLCPGAQADICIFDPEEAWVVDKKEFYSKSDNCPWHGQELKGRIKNTFVGGRMVFNGQQIID